MSHSKIPPSSAHIWGAPHGCTGWVKMNEKFPNTDSEASIEGTIAHEAMSHFIECIPNEPEEIPFDDEEMVIGAKMIRDCVLAEVLKYPGFKPRTEYRIAAKKINKESFGTVDCFLYIPDTVLFIWDYKYGLRDVEVFENWQLINYAAGIFEKFNIPPEIPVVFTIVQPRGFNPDGPVRSWKTTVEKLMPYWHKLRENAAMALSDHAKLRVGNHCRYCNALHACPRAQKAAIESFEYVENPKINDRNLETMANELRFLKRAQETVKYRISALESELEMELEKGKRVSHFSLKPGRGTRRWTKKPKEIIEMAQVLGYEVAQPIKLITPNQAEKLGLPEHIVRSLSETLPGAKKLVADDHTPRKIFSEDPKK